MKNTFTQIAKTKDGINCYWGKKDSGDPSSRDLTLWISIRKPRGDGDNYRRVPVAEEVAYFDELKGDFSKWTARLQTLIGNSTAAELRKWKGF